MASTVFLLIELGVIVTQTAALYILGIEHVIIEDQRLWTEEPPTILEFTGPLLSIKAVIDSQGYNLGPHFENNPVRPELRVIDRNYKPTIKNSFTDKFGNELQCNDGSALFMFKATNTRYPVVTGNSPFVIQCHGDYKRSRVFIIAGSRRISTVGKLYAIDTIEADVVNGEVIAQEIPQIGDLISALAIRPSNGVILLSKEVGEPIKSFQMVYLKPIHFKFLSTNKFKKFQVTRAHEFENAVTKGGEKLYELFEQFWNKRTSRLVAENRKLRRLAETQLQNLRYPLSDLPDVGELLDPKMSKNDFEEVIDNFKYHLARLYKKYLLEPKVVEEYRCRKILTRLRTRVAHYLGKIGVKEETLVVDASTLGLAMRVNSTTGGRVGVLALDYKINIANTYQYVESPSYIFPKDKSGILRILIGDAIFSLGTDFGPMNYEMSYNDSLAIPVNFTDRFEHTLMCSDGQVFFKDQKRCPIGKCPVITGNSHFLEYCILDYERNRAFIISSEKLDAGKGSLFVFDTKDIIINGTFINTTQLTELGNNISAVSVDSATGDIYLTEEVISNDRKTFNMIVLKPTAQVPSSVRSTRSIQRRQLRPSTHYIDGNEFITTVNENVTNLVYFHEKHWLDQMNELVMEQNELKKVLQKLAQDPQKNISSFLLSEIAKALRESWNFKLNIAIVEVQNDIVAVYDKHLLSNETRQILEADRECLVSLSNFQKKGQDLLADILLPTGSVTQPPGRPERCPKTWPLSC